YGYKTITSKNIVCNISLCTCDANFFKLGLKKTKGKLYIALYDYEARTKEDLSFKKGEKLVVIDKVDDEWWLARKIVTSEEGYIPSNYVAYCDSIESESWYFGKIKRIEAERHLQQDENKVGAFLVRESETRSENHALSIKDANGVKHYRISKNSSGEFYITHRRTFLSLQDLISHYSAQNDGLCTQLGEPCVRLKKPTTRDLAYNVSDEWEINRATLSFCRRIGKGHHGAVFEGRWNLVTPVAIKTVLPETMSVKEFYNEAQIMKKLHHPNLVQLYGVCTLDEPILIITELMVNGSLLDYLRNIGKSTPVKKLIDFGTQIASGMAYLEMHNFIHRDLAARNILVDEACNVKIADFGLTRFTNENAYETKRGTRFPIKWTAPEAIFTRTFTTKCDVWSFGVVLYEIFTYGGVPYPGLTNNETLQLIQSGQRMDCPKSCPEDIYEEIMMKCWNWSPEKRPTFYSLQYLLEDLQLKPEYKEPPSILS
ncbi:tyrosine-protein kinase Src42A-like protein, partial [Dinothrombium tinctorium]